MTVRELLAVDASVAAKVYVQEAGSDQAAALFQSGAGLIAPDLFLAELCSVFRNKVRRGILQAAEADALIIALELDRRVTLFPSRPLVRAAMGLSIRYDRSVYDSLYLALALAQDCPRITADERLVNALRDTPLAPRLWLLSGA